MILVALLGAGFLLHSLQPVSLISQEISPLSKWVHAKMSGGYEEGSFMEFSAALLLILVQSLIFGFLAERHQLLYKNTWLTVLFFGLFNMLFPEQLHLHPELLANTFLLLAVMAMFQAQGKEKAMPALINAGILGGIAFMFAPGTFLLIPVFIVGIMFFKPLAELDIFQYLTGYILVLFFGTTILYMTGNEQVVMGYRHMAYLSPVNGEILREPYFSGLMALLTLILINTFFRLQQNFFRNTVRVRKLQQYLLVYLFFALIYTIFGMQSIRNAMSILSLPLSMFVTYFFLSDKRKWIQETVFILFLLALALQYIHPF